MKLWTLVAVATVVGATTAYSDVAIFNQSASQLPIDYAYALYSPAESKWVAWGWYDLSYGTTNEFADSDNGIVIVFRAHNDHDRDLLAEAKASGYSFPYAMGSFWGNLNQNFSLQNRFNGTMWTCPAVTLGEVFYPPPAAQDTSAACTGYMADLGMDVFYGLRFSGHETFTIKF